MLFLHFVASYPMRECDCSFLYQLRAKQYYKVLEGWHSRFMWRLREKKEIRKRKKAVRKVNLALKSAVVKVISRLRRRRYERYGSRLFEQVALCMISKKVLG